LIAETFGLSVSVVLVGATLFFGGPLPAAGLWAVELVVTLRAMAAAFVLWDTFLPDPAALDVALDLEAEVAVDETVPVDLELADELAELSLAWLTALPLSPAPPLPGPGFLAVTICGAEKGFCL
jgi:hypothetical protein